MAYTAMTDTADMITYWEENVHTAYSGGTRALKTRLEDFRDGIFAIVGASADLLKWNSYLLPLIDSLPSDVADEEEHHPGWVVEGVMPMLLSIRTQYASAANADVKAVYDAAWAGA